MSSYLIYPAATTDILLIRQLIRKIWHPAYRDILSEEQRNYMLELMYGTAPLKEQLENGEQKYLLLYHNQSALGFASYQCNIPEENVAKLHKLYLLPEEQGKGLGKLLLDGVVFNVKEQGQNRLRLNVNRANKALQFYRYYGFRTLSEEDIDIGNGFWMNDYVMEMPL